MNSTAAATPHRFRPLALLVGMLITPLLLALLLPVAPACFSRTVLGLPCPGCGLGRALLALGRLDPARALVLYPPLLPMVAGYLVALVMIVARLYGWKGSRAAQRVAAVIATCVAVAVVANWLFLLANGVTR